MGEHMNCDFLIIGSGIAGLSFALKLSSLGRVVVVTKKEKIDSATNLAQGGIAAVMGKNDKFEYHIEDTLLSGDGLCDTDVVEMVVKNGPEQVKELIQAGVNFIRKDNDKELDLGKEGGHSMRRVAHAYDLTGHAIEKALLNKVKTKESITVLKNHMGVDLIRDKNGKCIGCTVIDEYGDVEYCFSKITAICTGGCGKVYLYTTNPDISTGDGIAMAYRAGAEITNMEFVQFHPTCLYHPRVKNFLISEAVRGEGAILVDRDGKPFMNKYDSRKDLATRDIVARAIDNEMKERGLDCVYLDITSKSNSFLKKRFPTIFERCLDLGINISTDPIPVVPAAHYMCGGVLVDTYGRSSVENLFVLGESSNTGLHGANRLASNSLLEAVVYSERAFQYLKKNYGTIENPNNNVRDYKDNYLKKKSIKEEILINHNWESIRRTMWNYVGIVRNKKRLALAKKRMIHIIDEIETHYREYRPTENMIELRNISHIAMLIVEAAIARKNSRGLHYMNDALQDKKENYWNIFQKKKPSEKACDVELIKKYNLERSNNV